VNTDQIVEEVQKRYGEAARSAAAGGNASCCGPAACGGDVEDAGAVAIRLGYDAADVKDADGNLGLGCGNPLALAAIRPGMTVLDLGSGAGFDAFLAAEKVGPTGRVIGVDMTPDMLALARSNAEKRGATNVEFREGRIERLPVDDASVDLVISNCVINLSTNKPAVFAEIARVLKPGGRVSVSDLVLVSELPADVRQSVLEYVGCVAGALPLGEYVALLLAAGLEHVTVERIASGERREVVSATFVATKPSAARAAA
jgi:SAM-dependent methyltransferase